MKKVLIVDDTPQGLLALRELLNQPTMTVFEASSGRQALDVHRREHVDLIVMDLKMPGMDGEQVTRAIRADPDLRQVSILLFCERASASTRDRCVAAGANDFLPKPFMRMELLTRIGQLLEVAARKNTRLLAHMEVPQGGNVDRYVARIVNVSATGMLLEVDAPLDIGREIVVKFFVPGGHEQVEATARIVRRADYQGAARWGVRFSRLDETMRQVLRNYVAR